MSISSISNPSPYLGLALEPSEPKQASQDQKALIQAVKTINAAGLVDEENEFTFIIDRATRTAVVRIVNKKTGDVVQQIPDKEVLKLAEESIGR